MFNVDSSATSCPANLTGSITLRHSPDFFRTQNISGPNTGTEQRPGSSIAIDVNQLPYTREFVDDYRARMKEDPDPEAQFAFAKYLIEAARIIGDDMTTKGEVRSGKKYRDSLLAESLKQVKRLATGETEPHAEATFFLANTYGTGHLGLSIDHDLAYHLYIQASKQNHPGPTYRAAVCSELGAGTRKDATRAVSFYRKAASLRDTAAMYKLGIVLIQGLLEQPKSEREGIVWLHRASQQANEENPHALHELAMLHETPTLLGRAAFLVSKDPLMARDQYIAAAELGYPPSQFRLGACYEHGTLGFPVDSRKSIAWLSRASEKGDPEAELALSGWFLTGAEGLKANDSEAYLWARRSANKGLAKAEFAVGCE
jgi:TPR repeat protein